MYEKKDTVKSIRINVTRKRLYDDSREEDGVQGIKKKEKR